METIKLTQLKPDTENANQGTEYGLSLLEESLTKFGAGRGLLLDKDYNVIAGNKTLQMAVERGFEEVVIVHTRGDKLVAVVRDDLDLYDDSPANKARQLAYADNRVAELDLSWSPEQIKRDVDSGIDLKPWFTGDELDAIIALAEPPEKQSKPSVELELTPELLESHNYIVFTFDNDFDWNVIVAALGIKTVKSGQYTDTFQHKGVGRVLSGKSLLEKLNL